MSGSLNGLRTPAPSQMLRELIDPNSTLPALSLKLDPSEGFVETRYKMELPNTDVIGYASTLSHRIEPVDNFSEITIVHPDYKGRGYGLAAYVTAMGLSLDAGRAFRTDPQGIKEPAYRVWNRFGTLGIVQDRTRPSIYKGILTQYNFWITPTTVQRVYADKRLAA